MKRPVLIVIGLSLFVMALSGYVLWSVAGDLSTVKEMMSADARELERADLDRARLLLTRSSDKLHSPTARFLRIIPMVRQNLGALNAVAEAALPVVDAAEQLRDSVHRMEEQGVTEGDRIAIEALTSLQDPLAAQLRSVETLRSTTRSHLGPWLLPPIWHELHDVAIGSERVAAELEAVVDAVDILEPMAGFEDPRRYLVLLINNAELRGAGGVLTGVGTLRLDAGEVSLERVQDVHELRDEPPERVRAPDEFRRRFSQYKADTTLWLNTTFSPDVPDVALVASRLYEKKTGIATHGALMIDPVAIARLVPDGWTMSLPHYDRTLDKGDVDDFIFSNGYSLYADQDERRDTILRLGRSAFRAILDDGLGAEALGDLGGLVGGGHIRITSFDREEQGRLADLGLTGDLTPPGRPAHAIMITAQNLGDGDGQGTKLDHWARREVAVACELAEERLGCAVGTTIRNDAPKQLPRYVAGDGTLRSYVETYIPAEAKLQAVTRDGAPVEFRTEDQENRVAVAIYIELPRGESTTLEVNYTAPQTAEELRLVLQPQPLSRAAKLTARLSVPEEWQLVGPGEEGSGGIEFRGRLDRRVAWDAIRLEPPGLSRWWRGLRGFWNRPLLGR